MRLTRMLPAPVRTRLGKAGHHAIRHAQSYCGTPAHAAFQMEESKDCAALERESACASHQRRRGLRQRPSSRFIRPPREVFERESGAAEALPDAASGKALGQGL